MRRTVNMGKVCEHCGSTIEYPKEACFCDQCKKKIPGDVNYKIDLFRKAGESYGYEFCSWECVFKWLKGFHLNKNEVNFITLPYISDDASGGDWGKELTKFIEATKILHKPSLIGKGEK